MELVSTSNQLVELNEPTKSYEDLLEMQKDLLLNQVENLQRIVAAQCNLTGVNPLSQEMAAGALSIKIGKKPRDLLNYKAVKYMQNVFSIKDAISKKETREISAQFGITATQVKDFFTVHKSRVRKSLRLAAAKAVKSSAGDAMPVGMASTSDCSMPAEPVPLETMPAEPVPLETMPAEPVPLETMPAEPIPLETIGPVKVEEGPSCSTQREVRPGMEEPDINFVENIFKLMRKEETFSGQVKLLEWILRMGNPPVLKWFLDEGGLLILATWLSEAATEEQTSVLRVIIKVLCCLPLKNALKGHMSALLHSVRPLQYYQNPDISSSSKTLLKDLKKLSEKMLAESDQGKSVSDPEGVMLLKQSVHEVTGVETWGSKEDNSERALRTLCGSPGFHMNSNRGGPVKLLTSSADDTKSRRGALSFHTRERRKVQMVEQPGQRSTVRNSQISKSTTSTQSRPLSADDIQKAKMRAQFMQSKHGKTIKRSNELAKTETQTKIKSLLARASTSGSKSNVRPEHVEQTNVDKLDETKKVESSPAKIASVQVPVDVEEPPWKRCKRTQIPWRTPPEIRIAESWSVGTGANSKEVEVQNNRIKREKETIYRHIHEIPPNPREPWDREMDYDDTLTPAIPIDQLPDVEQLETPTASDIYNNGNVATTSNNTQASASSSSMPEPDLELLAELLKNPDLVFALTSGHAGDLSNNDTLKLLDLIKANGASVLVNLAGGLNGKAESKVEVSLPSPTPSTDPVPQNGVRPDFSRNPFSKQHATVNGNAYQTLQASTFVQPPIPVPQPSVPHVAHVPVPPVASLQTANQLSEQWHNTPNPVIHHQMLNSMNTQHLTPETMMNTNNMVNFNRASPSNIHSVAASSHSLRAEPLINVRARSQVQQEVHYPYYEEPPLKRARQDYEPSYHHQNGRNMNNYNGYVGGPVQVDTWDGRNRIPGRPGYESWSPDNSPPRGYGYMQGGNYQDGGVDGYRVDRGAVRQNPGHSYGYRENGVGGTGDRRWQGYRR